MHYIFTAIAFLIIFSILVLIHELGHFIMAKRAGIKVEEFGFGLPPRLWGKKKGDTIYSINWIPFGGFVRMLGEDSTNKKTLANKRSFASKSVSARIKVVIAGVIMNFFLAWVFLTIGFTYGMQPLLMPDEILSAISNDVITLEPGLKIEKIDENLAGYKAGMMAGDVIYSHAGAVLDGSAAESLKNVSYDDSGKYIVYRSGQKVEINIDKKSPLGVQFYDYGNFPRVKIRNIDVNSEFYKKGLRAGDVILTFNGLQVFDTSVYELLIRRSKTIFFDIYRDGQRLMINVSADNKYSDKVIISKVYPDTPAQKAGLKDLDVVNSFDGISVYDPAEMVAYTEKNYDKDIVFNVTRDGKVLQFEIKPKDKKIGVLLSALNAFDRADRGVSLYNIDNLESAVKIKNEKYPFYVSAYKSFSEMWKISKVTATMFIGMIGDIFTTGQVPDSVSGPVGIAQMTYSIITEGLIVILRFMALLSLSLAVINILPLPALDGGRFMFLLFEWITGRKVNQKWEARIHTIGYVLIIFLILLITYSDIIKIINSL